MLATLYKLFCCFLCFDCLDKSCVGREDFCCYLAPRLCAVNEAELYSNFAYNFIGLVVNAGIYYNAHKLCGGMLAAVNDGCAFDVLLVWEETFGLQHRFSLYY